MPCNISLEARRHSRLWCWCFRRLIWKPRKDAHKKKTKTCCAEFLEKGKVELSCHDFLYNFLSILLFICSIFQQPLNSIGVLLLPLVLLSLDVCFDKGLRVPICSLREFARFGNEWVDESFTIVDLARRKNCWFGVPFPFGTLVFSGWSEDGFSPPK